MGFAARIAALGGLAAGLALAPSIGAPSGRWALIASALVAAALLGTAAPRGGGGRGRSIAWPTASIWLALLAALAGTAGIAAGSLRVEAIDAGAFAGAPGRELDVDGFVDAVPRRAAGRVSIVVDTPEGRLLVEVPEPVGDLDVGAAVSASGVVRAPSEFERGYLERLGIRRVLASRRVTVGPARRDGLVGLLDAVRVRAQHALSAGTPSPSAALLRGFVLGQDDRIAAGTVEEFKRSGLAHLLS